VWQLFHYCQPCIISCFYLLWLHSWPARCWRRKAQAPPAVAPNVQCGTVDASTAPAFRAATAAEHAPGTEQDFLVSARFPPIYTVWCALRARAGCAGGRGKSTGENGSCPLWEHKLKTSRTELARVCPLAERSRGMLGPDAAA